MRIPCSKWTEELFSLDRRQLNTTVVTRHGPVKGHQNKIGADNGVSIMSQGIRNSQYVCEILNILHFCSYENMWGIVQLYNASCKGIRLGTCRFRPVPYFHSNIIYYRKNKTMVYLFLLTQYFNRSLLSIDLTVKLP